MPTLKRSKKVKKVTMSCYCYGADAKEVMDSLWEWFCGHNVGLASYRIKVQDPKTNKEYQDALGNLEM